MSNSVPATSKSEWLVVVPDFPNALEKRLEVRGQHFEGLSKTRGPGIWKFGGATLAEPAAEGAPASELKFTGSTLIVVDESREGVIEQLKADIYTKSGVWDVEKAQIWPIKTAFRDP